MTKSNHCVNVVRLSAPVTHNNADSLELFVISGYQVVVRKEQFKPGELAIYIPPDSVVPQTEPFRFIWEGHEGIDGNVPTKRRRITVRKFRGEWSEGLLMSLTDFGIIEDSFAHAGVYEGDDVSDALGITHYEPEELASTVGDNATAPRRKYPSSARGWLFFLLHKMGLGFGRLGKSTAMEVSFEAPAYDVDALKGYRNHFEDGEAVWVTEKIHGSNARYVFLDGVMYAGSHYQWKSPKSKCVFIRALEQNPQIEEWCRAHEGDILYGEVTPTQKGFNYGCEKDQVKFFAFDVRTQELGWVRPAEVGWCHPIDTSPEGTDPSNGVVPILYVGPFDLPKIKSLVDGPSQVRGAKHVREGIVIRPVKERRIPGRGRLHLKIVSNAFLEKDSK